MEGQTEKRYGKTNISEIAEEIARCVEDLDDRVLKVQETIVDHAHSLPRRVEARSILESRFTPASEAFEKGMLSCGAMTNIGAEMLRVMGYEVKKVHGENERSVDHAWLLVREPESQEWIPYDLTCKGVKVGEQHRVKVIVDDWEEIRGQIEEDHTTYEQRRRERESN